LFLKVVLLRKAGPHDEHPSVEHWLSDAFGAKFAPRNAYGW